MDETRKTDDPQAAAEPRKPLDKFELCAAILLGLAAVGGAWSTFQGDLWGGQSSEAYGEAATTATKASTAFGLGVTQVAHDLNLDLQAKQLVLEGITTDDPLVKERQLTVAKYLYTRQMSEEGYKALGYPPEYYTDDDEKASQLPDEALIAGLDRELGDDYILGMLADGLQQFEAADQKFEDGRKANSTGDRFGLDVVLFTVCLFLAGIGLVFKTRVRWAFFGVGCAAFVGAATYLFTIPWA
jgi:hypothetical protein